IVEKSQSILKTPVDLLIDEFTLYLQQERGLAFGSISLYRRLVHRFFIDRFVDREVNLSNLTAKEIFAFVQSRSRCVNAESAKSLVTALRSFFKYARYHGYINIDLAASIPTVANWSKVSIPNVLSPD
ncbi:MAG: site-specific integrase, partial [Acidobacteriota bacterium]